MPVTYDGKALIPAPFVSISRETRTSEDGTPIGFAHAITARGKLVSWMGSPDSTGAFWDQPGHPADETVPHDSRLGSLLRKKAALLGLFREQGRAFEVVPLDGSPALSCNPRVLRVDFQEGVWVDSLDYSIAMECDSIDGDGAPFPEAIARASEQWEVEPLDEDLGTYRLTHSVAATGLRSFDDAGALPKLAWERARDYVVARLGLVPARMEAPDVLDATALRAYDYSRSQRVGESAGTFEVTETWACFDPAGGPPATHESRVESRYGLQDNRNSVSVAGTITGLRVSDNATKEVISTKWENAREKWEEAAPFLLTRAQSASGLVLNPSPIATAMSYNEATGVITYSHDFDDRPGSTVPGALMERTVVSDSNPADVFAVVLGPGMALGPVLQSVGAIRERKRSISIEVQMPPRSYDYSPAQPDVAALILDHRPAGSVVFLEGDEESWDANAGRYSRTATYVWRA